MQFAWITLGTLMLSDLYIMLVASGAFPIQESLTERAVVMSDAELTSEQWFAGDDD
jgi:hypothetical protein